MPVEFSQYLDVAARYNATHTENEASSQKVGLIGGRVVSVLDNRNVHTLDTERARRDFVDSFAAEFGEDLRPAAEKALGAGGSAKPLTSRVIVELNKLGREKTKDTVAGKLRNIVLNAAKLSVGSLSKSELDSIAGKYATTPKLKDAFARVEGLRQKAESAFRALGKLTAAQVADVFSGDAPEGEREREEHYRIFETIIAAKTFQSMLAESLTEIYADSKGAFAELHPVIVRCKNRAVEVLSVTTAIETKAKARKNNAGEDAADAQWGKKTILDMLPEAIVDLHGTNAALNALKDHLKPIADRFDRLKADSADGVVHWEDVKAMRAELSRARAALAVAARVGVKSPGSDAVFRPDAALLGSLVSLFAEVEGDIAKLASEYTRLERLSEVNMFYPKVDKAKLFSGFGRALLEKLIGEQCARVAHEFLEMLHTALEAMVMYNAILTVNITLQAVSGVIAENKEFKKSMKNVVEQLELLMDKLEGRDVDEQKWNKWSDKLAPILESMTEEERMEAKEAIKEAQEKNILGAMLSLDKELLEGFALRFPGGYDIVEQESI